MPKVPKDLRRWAVDKEEQEEFLNDPQTEAFRRALREDVQAQLHRLRGKLRTASLEDIRYEAGCLEALESVVRELEPSDET